MNTFNTGIYQIVNQVNGKRYIGSAVNLKRREEGHFYELNKQKHRNDILQKAYNKYGKENLKFEILLYCSKENLLFYEQRAIDSYDLKTELYNLCSIAGNTLGRKHSEETKRKLERKVKTK